MLLATGWAVPAWGQSDELMEAYNRQNELREQGRYAEAIPFAERALELGEDEFGPEHEVTAALLNHLAALYYAQGRYAEAEPLYKRSLAIRSSSRRRTRRRPRPSSRPMTPSSWPKSRT
jgi:tetratricopeptide (TPR) repeat protein